MENKVKVWIARDEDGRLFVCSGIPTKMITYWRCAADYDSWELDCAKFPSVKWEDDEPTEAYITLAEPQEQPKQEQHDWSKFNPNKPKFDPKTLQPFDKVIARDYNTEKWRCDFFSHTTESDFPYVCTNDSNRYCIPYNDDTKHLVGTTDEAPEYYRYWEK